MSISDQLRDALIAHRGKGHTFLQIALETDLDIAQLSRFAAGRRDLRLSSADRLATLLRLNLSGGCKCKESSPIADQPSNDDQSTSYDERIL